MSSLTFPFVLVEPMKSMSPTLPAAQWLLSIFNLLATPCATNTNVLSTVEQQEQPSRVLAETHIQLLCAHPYYQSVHLLSVLVLKTPIILLQG